MADRLQPHRSFGATGVRVPLIGYGTAPLGKDHITREHAVRCLEHAIDRGITYIDTSPDYGSEPHIGAVMRRRRDEVFLAATEEAGRSPLFWPHDTKVMGWDKNDEPALVWY